MKIENIVKKLIKHHKTNDPYKLCEKMGIEVVSADIGSLKGMYTCIKRNRFIVINENLDDSIKKVVCAHELAHDQLHRGMSSSSWMKDYDLTIVNSKYEYEANMFAAELLVQEDELMDLIKESKSLNEIAKIICIDPNLISMKVKRLIDKGYCLIPQDYNSKFLKYNY